MKKKETKITKAKLKKLERRQRNKLDKEWSMKVKQRDNNQCTICQSKLYLHTHHIIPREFKESRHDINNGITLCAKHHKYSLDISAHRNPIVFCLWLMDNKIEQLNNIKYLVNSLKKGTTEPTALLFYHSKDNTWTPLKTDYSGNLDCVKCDRFVSEVDEAGFCRECAYSEINENQLNLIGGKTNGN
jgi:hypothetical protein